MVRLTLYTRVQACCPASSKVQLLVIYLPLSSYKLPCNLKDDPFHRLHGPPYSRYWLAEEFGTPVSRCPFHLVDLTAAYTTHQQASTAKLLISEAWESQGHLTATSRHSHGQTSLTWRLMLTRFTVWRKQVQQVMPYCSVRTASRWKHALLWNHCFKHHRTAWSGCRVFQLTTTAWNQSGSGQMEEAGFRKGKKEID